MLRSVRGAFTKPGEPTPIIQVSIPISVTGLNNKMPNRWTYFTNEEVSGLDKEFVSRLDLARKNAGVPFLITSGLRTKEENRNTMNAVSDSSHLFGLAVDLSVDDSSTRYRVIKALLDVGFCRIGIYAKHIHVDLSMTLPQNVIWYINGV